MPVAVAAIQIWHSVILSAFAEIAVTKYKKSKYLSDTYS